MNDDLIITCACGKKYDTFLIKFNKDLMMFLEQSNAIEGVYDSDSIIQALHAWEYLNEENTLTPHVIRKTHKILMLHHLVGIHKGYFRQSQVWIGGREGLHYSKIEEAIDDWCKGANYTVISKNNGLSDIIKVEERIKEDHIRYEKIHPFIDGNGRTGRLFMNWQRVKAGLPLLIIRTGKEQQEYYNWFK